MSTYRVNPNTLLFDPGTGKLTREGVRLIDSINRQISDSTSDYVRIDATQVLTNKTMDGDSNTFRDIPVSALAALTGNFDTAVTGTPGTSGNLVQWDANGNAVDSGATIGDYVSNAAAEAAFLRSTDAALTYVPLDGSGVMSGPLVVPTYTVATVPAAASYTGGIIYVSDESGGAVIAFSDGAAWRRLTDRVVVS